MNFILLILAIITLAIFLFNQHIKYRRFKYVNNLKIAYDKMEMHFIKNDIILKRDYIELMKVFKNLTVNPDYLDIQILLLHKIASEKRGKLEKDTLWFDRTLKSLGDDFLKIFTEFDKNTHQVIKISFYKPDFLVFIFKSFLKHTIYSGANSFKTLIKDLKFVQDNDEAISYSGMKMGFS